MRCKSAGFAIALALGVLAAPLADEAQQPAIRPRIEYMSMAAGPSPRTEAFRQGLRDLGYVEGENITVEYRWAQGKQERLATSRTSWSGSGWTSS